jgi:ketosteroid isomerase-like protein
MTSVQLEAIACAWLDAFNKQDLENLVSLYAKDATHSSPKLRTLRPETEGMIKGKAALRDWWNAAFKNVPGLYYEINSLTANGSRVFLEYTRLVTGQPPMFVAEVLEISNGLITASRVYHG